MSAIHKIIVGLAIAVIFPLSAFGQPILTPYEPDPTNNLRPTLEWGQVSDATNYRVQIDNEQTFTSPQIIAGQDVGISTTWTSQSDLPEGSIYWRVASDADGYAEYSVYDHFIVDVTPPSLTINMVTSPTNQPSQTIAGTMESGATITITTSATMGPITNSSATTWSCAISNFASGNNLISVKATDAAGNATTKTATIEYQPDSITLAINTVTSPTNVGSQVISGSKGTDVSITSVDVNTAASASMWSYPTTTSWECTITGLVEGDNVITVSGQNTAMGTAMRTTLINYDTTPPSFTINVVSPTTQNSQTISGSKDAGTVISVAINTTATHGIVTYANATSWSCIISGLESGANTITVTATDLASNTAQQSAVIEYQPTGLTVNIDQVTTPTGTDSQTITGTTDAQANVSVSVNTGASVSVVTRAGTVWSCTVSGLAPGPNIITVLATYGVQTATRTATITYDTTPPTFTIDAVVSPTNINNQTIRGTMEAGSTITVNTSAVAGAPNYPTATTWSCTISSLANGWNNISVTAKDALNNTSSGSISIEYDATAPTVSINQVNTPTKNTGQQISGEREYGRPANIMVTNGSVSGWTYPSDTTWACTVTVGDVSKDSTIGISVTVTDWAGNSATATASIVYDRTPPTLSVNPVVSPTNQNYQVITGSVEAGAAVTVSVQNASAGSVVINGTTWSCPVSGIVAEGNHTVYATATDAAGNTAFAGTAIVYDRTPPTISINGLPQYTNFNYVTLQGTREIGSTVTVTADTAASIGIVSYPSGTTWRCQVGNLEERLNVMTATAKDAAGNSISASVSTTYDGSPPILTINAVTTPTNGNSQEICGTREGDLAVVVATNTTALAGFVTYNASTWCCTVSNLVEGNNTITASSTDLANNITTGQATIRYDATPPYLSIYQVGSPTNVNTQDIEGAMEYGARITVAVDTGAAVENLVVNDITWSCTISGFLETNNVITVTAKDPAGNTSTEAATIRYDITPPSVTINAVISPTRTITQALLGTMETNTKVTLTANTAATFGSVIHSGGSWNCNVQNLQVGTNTITVSATDQAGNIGSATAAITYCEVWPGDVNNDDTIDLVDAILALKICAAIPVSGIDRRSDLDGDGQIGIREAIHALQWDADIR